MGLAQSISLQVDEDEEEKEAGDDDDDDDEEEEEEERGGGDGNGQEIPVQQASESMVEYGELEKPPYLRAAMEGNNNNSNNSNNNSNSNSNSNNRSYGNGHHHGNSGGATDHKKWSSYGYGSGNGNNSSSSNRAGKKEKKGFSRPRLLDVWEELEQDPEMVPFESSASPVSSVNTPHLSSSINSNNNNNNNNSSSNNPVIRVWDPSHILSPNGANGRGPISIFAPGRSFQPNINSNNSIAAMAAPAPSPSPSPAPAPAPAPATAPYLPMLLSDHEVCTEIYLIRHAQSNANLQPGLICGRTPSASVTPDGRREARALGVFLLSHGLRFDAVFSSPLDRCKQTAISVCQEVNFAQERVEFSDALVELSQGLWEGLRRSEIYTPELLNMMASSQPDFHAPGGESQRQVEFRMVEFLNNVVLPRARESKKKKKKKKMPSMGTRSEPMADPSMQDYQHSDMYDDETRGSGMLMSPSSGRMQSNSHSHGKASGKSRLRIASSDQATATVEDLGMKADTEEKVGAEPSSPYLVAVFSHGMAIKCLLRAILGSDPRMTHRFTIDNTSMTVLRHSTHTGWQLVRVNDTAHLRLL